jgi:hypothetical protein
VIDSSDLLHPLASPTFGAAGWTDSSLTDSSLMSCTPHLEHMPFLLLQAQLVVGMQHLVKPGLQQVADSPGVAVDAVVEVPHPKHHIMGLSDIANNSCRPAQASSCRYELVKPNSRAVDWSWLKVLSILILLIVQ